MVIGLLDTSAKQSISWNLSRIDLELYRIKTSHSPTQKAQYSPQNRTRGIFDGQQCKCRGQSDISTCCIVQSNRLLTKHEVSFVEHRSSSPERMAQQRGTNTLFPTIFKMTSVALLACAGPRLFELEKRKCRFTKG